MHSSIQYQSQRTRTIYSSIQHQSQPTRIIHSSIKHQSQPARTIHSSIQHQSQPPRIIHSSMQHHSHPTRKIHSTVQHQSQPYIIPYMIHPSVNKVIHSSYYRCTSVPAYQKLLTLQYDTLYHRSLRIVTISLEQPFILQKK
jgi:hypothetical protein